MSSNNEIYAVRYAHLDRTSTYNFVGGDPHDVPMPLDYFVWAIVGKRSTFILDTGFDEVMGKKRERAITKPIGTRSFWAITGQVAARGAGRSMTAACGMLRTRGRR